jgi:hypothetical protein
VACIFPVVRGFEVKTGKSYHIQVLEKFDDVGSNPVLTIKPSAPPLPNVDCPNALTIPHQPSFPYTIVTDLVTPTKTPDNPILSCRELVFDTVDYTPWDGWAPAISGLYDFDTLGTKDMLNTTVSNFNILGIFEGSSCDSAIEILCKTERLRRVPLDAGEQYWLKLENAIFSTDQLILTVQPSPPSPPNDICDNTTMVKVGDSIPGDVSASTNDELWYKITDWGPSTGAVTVSTCTGTELLSEFLVYLESDCINLSSIDGFYCLGSPGGGITFVPTENTINLTALQTI